MTVDVVRLGDSGLKVSPITLGCMSFGGGSGRHSWAIGEDESRVIIKQALDASETNDLDRQLDLERDLQGQAGRTPDYLEGVTAFFEKRQPTFSGRT